MNTGQARATTRLAVVLVLAIVPWTVVVASGASTLVFPFGLMSADPWHLTTLPAFFRFSRGQTAPFVEAWPLGVVLYLCALASALSGVLFRREDRRLTGGLLALTAVSQVPLVVGFSRRLGSVAFPLGTVLMIAVAWWVYRPVVRSSSR